MSSNIRPTGSESTHGLGVISKYMHLECTVPFPSVVYNVWQSSPQLSYSPAWRVYNPTQQLVSHPCMCLEACTWLRRPCRTLPCHVVSWPCVPVHCDGPAHGSCSSVWCSSCQRLNNACVSTCGPAKLQPAQYLQPGNYEMIFHAIILPDAAHRSIVA